MLSEIGIHRRLRRLIPKDRPALWLPIDNGLISGPDGQLCNLRHLLRPEVVDELTGVLGFRGALARCRRELSSTPIIMNLSASTTLVEHTRKFPVGTAMEAVRSGADAVAYHINLTSPYEAEQLEQLGKLAHEADGLGIPVVVIAYPRGRKQDGSDENYLDLLATNPDEFARLVRRSVRVAVELGAAAVKTVFTGTVESFRTVVDAALGAPVLIAGGHVIDEQAAIHRAEAAISAGAAGVAYGRQIFLRSEPEKFVYKLRSALDGSKIQVNGMSTEVGVEGDLLTGLPRLVRTEHEVLEQ